ncbi:ABC-2 transporter permease [Clostridium thailandense]|uniref:ABC-2 transporter permease n=1 Tax=Clostridium thailandense TaxID=2794346 RepID=UPI0039897F57
MFNLVLKDILIQKKYLFFSIVYFFFFTFMFKDHPSILFGTVPIMISYMLLIGACGFDDKNKSEIMLNSLPINRVTLVISKYISVCVFISIGIFLTFAFTNILSFSGIIHFDRLITSEDILVDVVGTMFFSALYFPIHFKFGYQKTRYFLIIIFCFVFAAPSILVKTIFKSGPTPNFIVYLDNQPDWIITSFIIIITCIVFLISLLISIKSYVNKDL